MACLKKKRSQQLLFSPSMIKIFELRSVDLKQEDLLAGPVIFRGSWIECDRYAKRNGYVWKPVNNWIFAGYWKKRQDCLLPT